MSGEDPVIPVGFDEAAMAEDLAHLSESEALLALREEVEKLGAIAFGLRRRL